MRNVWCEGGVWVVASTRWSVYDGGPEHVILCPGEVEALRIVNQEDDSRAYFVPFGVDLKDVMDAWPEVVVAPEEGPTE